MNYAEIHLRDLCCGRNLSMVRLIEKSVLEQQFGNPLCALKPAMSLQKVIYITLVTHTQFVSAQFFPDCDIFLHLPCDCIAVNWKL